MVKAALAALPTAEVTHYFPHVNAAVLKIKVGEIRIGDGACIGALSVVLQDVPPGATAVGIPAKILPAKTPA